MELQPVLHSFAFGLLAAVFWGLADFFAKESVTHADPLAATLGMQVTGALGVALCAAAAALFLPRGIGPYLPPPGARLLAPFLICIAVGFTAIVGVAFCYRGYRLAPLSVVNPIVNSKGMFAALAAALFLKETGGVFMVAGIACCGVGAALLGTNGGARPRAEVGAKSVFVPGVGSALLAAVLYGIAMTFSKPPALAAGVGFAVVVIRLGALLLIAALVALVLGPRGMLPPRAAWRSLALVGLFDAIGQICFVAGVATGSAMLVGTVAALSPLLTVFLALAVLKERLSRRQQAALALVAAGLVLLGGADH